MRSIILSRYEWTSFFSYSHTILLTLACRHGSCRGSFSEYPHFPSKHSRLLAWYTKISFPSLSFVNELCPGPNSSCKCSDVSTGVFCFVHESRFSKSHKNVHHLQSMSYPRKIRWKKNHRPPAFGISPFRSNFRYMDHRCRRQERDSQMPSYFPCPHFRHKIYTSVLQYNAVPAPR